MFARAYSLFSTLALASVAALCVSAPAQAQLTGGADPFSALVERDQRNQSDRRRRIEVSVERYVVATDERAFLLENRGREARLKFLCGIDDERLDCRIDPVRTAEEIHLLRPVTGPRGDVIFKDLSGRTFLRIASYGGATVYWPDEKIGRAASKSFGDEPSLRLPFADISTVQRRVQLATAYVSAAVGAPILFEAPSPALDQDNGAAVLADAIARAAKGVHVVARDPTGARVLGRRISRVRFIASEAPELSLDGTVLEVRYQPSGDLAGRPSSSAVARFLEETL